MTGAFGKIGRDFLKELLDAQDAETKKRTAGSCNILSQSTAETNVVDAPIDFVLLVPPGGDQSEQVDQFTMNLNQAIKGTARAGDAYATSKLKKVCGFSTNSWSRCEVLPIPFTLGLHFTIKIMDLQTALLSVI